MQRRTIIEKLNAATICAPLEKEIDAYLASNASSRRGGPPGTLQTFVR
jgi:hypothetical protein